ncbi:histidine kinase-like ATPase [Russula compacta]|nr:histidine kinase-like ATPase [Russula compacta]
MTRARLSITCAGLHGSPSNAGSTTPSTDAQRLAIARPNLNNAIRPINSKSVHRITSGQVIIDLQTAAEEPVENSLDANATKIEVRFEDHGLKTIEVTGNWSGIALEDYESIALKHHISKPPSFPDLTSVLTFGIRGEALSSL